MRRDYAATCVLVNEENHVVTRKVLVWDLCSSLSFFPHWLYLPNSQLLSSGVHRYQCWQGHSGTCRADSRAYDRNGRLQGNQMAQVPIPLGTQQNEFVSWQASTPYYVPCQMYGLSIDSIEFYLTNENNDPIDLQVSQFSITMTIGWHAPGAPALGTAGAEDLPQDIKLAYVQSGMGHRY